MSLRQLLGWLRDVLAGPRCPGCGYWARGPRTLHAHLEDHPNCRHIYDHRQETTR